MATSSKVKREQDKNKEEPRKPSTCPEQECILRKDTIGRYALISPWSLGSASAGSECQGEAVNGLA